MTTGGRRGNDRRRRSRPASVSVVVPAYNAAATLGDQLEALAAQRFEGDWELVVVDNGSSDGTAELARQHRRRFPAFTLVDGGSQRGTRRHATRASAPPAASCWPTATPTTSPPPAGSRPCPTPPTTTTWSAGGWTSGP